MQLDVIVSRLDELLETARFSDYAPNGLQVEGRNEVRRIVSGVTASQALLEAALAARADAVLVHHGYFWKGESAAITGIKRRRLALLLEHDISLLAYHLPLDAHPRYGNNRQLGERLGIEMDVEQATASGSLLWQGRLAQPLTAQQFAARITDALGRTPLHLPGQSGTIHRIAWCTGAAQGYLEEAAQLGVDAYLSGEVSEQTTHIVRESGVHYFAAGHHATERYGVQALGAWLAEQFAIEHHYIDIDNPV